MQILAISCLAAFSLFAIQTSAACPAREPSAQELVDAYCAPLGPRHALSIVSRGPLRRALREMDEVPLPLQGRVERILTHGYSSCK